MNNNNKYALRYKLEPSREGWLKDEKGEYDCLTDAAVIISIVRETNGMTPFEGAKSFAVFSADGYTQKALHPKEVFQAFIAVADALSTNRELEGWQRKIAFDALHTTREQMKEITERDINVKQTTDPKGR